MASLALAISVSPLGALPAAGAPATMTWAVSDPASGNTLSLDLTKVPLRGPDFRVRLEQASGTFLDVTSAMPAERSYLGTVPNQPDAVAAATFRSDGSVTGEIVFDRGATWFFQNHAVSFTRGLTPPKQFAWPVRRSMDTDLIGTHTYRTEVAFDIDSAYYQYLGATPAATLDAVENALNNERLLYLQDAGIVQSLGDVVIRGAAATDPYAGLAADASAYLPAVKEEWTTSQAGYPEDQVQVVSSRLSSGLAYITGYSKAFTFAAYPGDSSGSGIFGRHEDAHNWGIYDEHGGDPEGPTIQSGNQYARWDSTELYAMGTNRRAVASRLQDLGTFHDTDVPPYAGMDLVQAVACGAPATIHPLANDHSANGAALRVTSVDPHSADGAALTLAGDTVTYTPFARPRSTIDHFLYHVTDANGHTATGLVLVKNGLPMTSLEAEDAAQVGTTTGSGTDQSGTGWVKLPAGASHYVEFRVQSPVARDATLNFVHDGVAAATITVNGTALAPVSLAPSPAGPEDEGTLWAQQRVSAHLSAGTNVIRFATTDKPVSLDDLQVTWPDQCPSFVRKPSIDATAGMPITGLWTPWVNDPDLPSDRLSMHVITGPTWLRLSPDGHLGGTPPRTGTYTALLRVSDAFGLIAERALTIRVAPATSTPAPPSSPSGSATSSPANPHPQAATGIDTLRALAIAGCLVAMGLLLVLAARRRHG